jgi:hypothetical protein
MILQLIIFAKLFCSVQVKLSTEIGLTVDQCVYYFRIMCFCCKEGCLLFLEKSKSKKTEITQSEVIISGSYNRTVKFGKNFGIKWKNDSAWWTGEDKKIHRWCVFPLTVVISYCRLKKPVSEPFCTLLRKSRLWFPNVPNNAYTVLKILVKSEQKLHKIHDVIWFFFACGKFVIQRI